jgi:uncharacterized SAM-binding protein YcdF (DUF218 family)
MARARRLVVMALAGLGLLVLVITFSPLVYWYASWLAGLAGPWNVPQGDILIVLSASAGPNGLLARDSYLRASYGVLAWREGHFRKVLVCGRDAGPGMRNFMIFSGVPADAIVVEQESMSTHENAAFAAAFLRGEKGRIMLLTSDYHMYRAAAAFRREGLEIDTLPIPDVRKYSNRLTYRWPIATELGEETIKIIYYRWKGWI